ncbi:MULTISPECIES: large conductance mechanosensitive channel protein MscL [Leptolyngbya]|uniref:large conductance mechanosensitive channel protein MscL n=1 Tax=Leptolyngbya TaxID=47251 RepID=UPI001687ECA0|nr:MULTISPECIES: large conductance mechanosensitive channel protein MscL [unclassified Leptolyngbya]MBD1859232.1 large conductance mechanosensitive channel protein MscL [Leptolyngbya sp. FACHB-1624]MBN8562940.1 large conductance mechanosensitive channel protein MscL [Leptolyngbya sp. UWPOB_LEPTO1]
MARSSFWADFQKFLMQGNVIDLAVAVIIGTAFGKIVTSFVEDIITPLILNPALKAARVDSLQNLSYEGIKYGVFLASVINFLVIALSIFLMIRAFEKAKRRFSRQEAIEEAAAPDPLLVSQERLTNAIDRLASKMN